jgi:hypothetical protein
MRILTGAIAGIAMIGALAGPAQADGEGLSGFQTVEIRVAVPSGEGTPCQVDPGLLRARIGEKLHAAGIPVGTSALTLRASVTTLSDTIQGRCISSVLLEAYTSQTTVLQATRNSIVANIPLWRATSIAFSDAQGHSERVGSAVAIICEKFVAAFRANQ